MCPRQTIQYQVIQVYAPTTNAEEAEVEWFYEDLQDLFELTPKKRCPFNYEGEGEVAQSCLTLCNPVDCSLPGPSIHGILQARILEWVAISFSRDLPDPGIEPGSPALQGDALPSEPPHTSVQFS